MKPGPAGKKKPHTCMQAAVPSVAAIVTRQLGNCLERRYIVNAGYAFLFYEMLKLMMQRSQFICQNHHCIVLFELFIF